MAYDVSVTRDDIIKAAFLDMGLYAPGEQPSNDEMEFAALRLNMMIKSWQAGGVGLWLYKTAYLVLQKGQQRYLLGGAGSDNYTMSLTETTLAQDASAGSTQVVVSDSSGISPGSRLGVVLDGGQAFWTTASAVNGATVTLASQLPESASAGKAVFSFSTYAPRPLSVRLAKIGNLVLTQLGYDDFAALPREAAGPPVQFCYRAVLSSGELWVWPSPTEVAALELMIQAPVEVFADSTSVPEFPQEWFDALHFGLAVRLCPSFGVPSHVYQELEALAARALAEADGSDREKEVSIYLKSDLFWRY